MWLVGVVIRRFIDFLILLIPTPLVLALFYSSIHTSLFILKMIFHSCLCYFCAIYIANVAQRTFEIVQKLRSCQHGDFYSYINKHVDYES